MESEEFKGYRVVTCMWKAELDALSFPGKFPFHRSKRNQVGKQISDHFHGLTEKRFRIKMDDDNKLMLWAIREEDIKIDEPAA